MKECYAEEIVNINHPCFLETAARKYARVHLPVAPKCNIQCKYCDKSGDCINENRPGMASKVITPEEAIELLDRNYKENISVVGISGPGDPLANINETIKTFQLIRERYPNINLCLSTNGVLFEKYYYDLMYLGVKYITLTLNTLSIESAEKIYEWAQTESGKIYGKYAAKYIVESQNSARRIIATHKEFNVKINTVYLPSINDKEIDDIVRWCKEAHVMVYNLLPFIRTENCKLEIPAGSKQIICEVTKKYESEIAIMHHCKQCRADAIGML